jgi:hypothetical protein
MPRPLCLALSLFVATACRADDFRTPVHARLPTATVAGAKVELPPAKPSHGRILAAAGSPAGGRVVRCDLAEHRVSEAKTFPLVGRARVSVARFRCVVETDAGRREVTVEVEALVAAE